MQQVVSPGIKRIWRELLRTQLSIEIKRHPKPPESYLKAMSILNKEGKGSFDVTPSIREFYMKREIDTIVKKILEHDKK